MGEQRKKAFGTLLAAAMVKGVTEAMEQHTARDKCVDFREGNAELIVYLTNKKKITIPLN